jgi:hypothetical protein
LRPKLFLVDIELDSGELAAIITTAHVSLQYLHVNDFERGGVPFMDNLVLFLLIWDNTHPSSIFPSLKKVEFVDCLIFSQGVRMVMFRIRDIEGVLNLDGMYLRCQTAHTISQMDILIFSIVKDILPGFCLKSGTVSTIRFMMASTHN